MYVHMQLCCVDLLLYKYDSVLLQASSEGPHVSAVVYVAADW